MDTDDEIRMAQTSCKPAAVSEARRRTSASPPVSGTERRRVPDATAGSPLPSTSAGAVRRQRRSPSPATAAAVPAKRRRSPTKPAAVAEDSDAAYEADTDEDEPAERRPDTTGLRVPELPDFLLGKTFLLYGQTMSTETRRRAGRYITAFGGKLEQYFGDGINYVITSDVWDGNFDEALSANPELMFARPTWLDACARQQKLVPAPGVPGDADL
ncbi:DNA repair protein XRCC1-like [Pollicipes pollicipes]|uniref:DNA repair protein XRCC1-like n=1 Tax=Pollicipes pollicipes TaxID=41117 RepID=UPI001884DA6C|nr:DNA repair protein XRCC1-like [Pollicipes pollicipes]